MMCVSQMIMLFTLNLYCAVCQLYLNKTGKKGGGTILFGFSKEIWDFASDQRQHQNCLFFSLKTKN